MKSYKIEVEGKKGLAVEIPLNKAPLVLVKGEKGLVMCGYLNIEAAQKLGQAAAMVRGVSNAQDLLEARIVSVTEAASQLGVSPGMTGQEALSHLL